MLDHGSLAPRAAWDPFQLFRDNGTWDPFGALGSIAGSSSLSPEFRVSEGDDGFIVQADLPGVEHKDLEVTLTGSTLTIAGERVEERRQEQHRSHTYERSYGRFARAITLPDVADLDQVEAALKNGVLTVRVAKRPEAKPRKIEVKGALSGFVDKVKGVLSKDNTKQSTEASSRASA
jgi:HSP20 family protein